MNRDDLVTIDRFLFIADAEIARATLEAAGIDAVLVDENIVRMSWGDAQAHGGVRLQVRAEDAEEAQEILAEIGGAPAAAPAQSLDPADAEETCRRCGSEEVFPAESRAKTFARIVILAWMAFVVINLASCGAAMAGLMPPHEFLAGMYALALIVPLFAVVYTSVAPKKRCRNCGLEWRGTPRTN